MRFFTIENFEKILQAWNPPAYVIKSQRTEEGVDGRLVAYVDKASYIAEQYKVLRTNLYSLSFAKPVKTLILTSAQPKEGKSITSCNLAVTLSLDTEKKVVLVDADLRRPSVHELFGIPKKPGFCDVLNGDVDIETLTQKPLIGNLYIIPSGTPNANPSEMLSLVKKKGIIDLLKSKFDYTIFDTPPVINVTDASILGSLCDAVILVVKAGVTQKNMIEEANNMLIEAQAKPKACMLTSVHFLLDSFKYFYSYRYYYKK